MLIIDNKNKPTNLTEQVSVLGALAEVYTTACDKKDYVLCDRIRMEINVFAKIGKSSLEGFIKIEDGLNLTPTLR